MERELFQFAKEALSALGQPRRSRNIFSDRLIVLVYYWSVINDRPVSWACIADHWPGTIRPRRLPLQSRMSRRLRTKSVQNLMDWLEERVLRSERRAPLACAVDGKALGIGAHSHDPHAQWGRGTGGWANGYKLHLLLSLCGTIMAWRLTPMNGNEREMARRLIKCTRVSGYILGDKQFDANYLYDEAAKYGAQMVAPRLKGPTRGLGSRRQAPGRLRSKDLMENTMSSFGCELHEMRDIIERKFGYLTSTGGLLTHLPSWARTRRRVKQWVQSKLVLSELRIAIRKARAAA